MNENKSNTSFYFWVCILLLALAWAQNSTAQTEPVTVVTTPPTILSDSPQPVVTRTTPAAITTEQLVLTNAPTWGLGFSGSNKVFSVNPYWAPTQRVQFGPEISAMLMGEDKQMGLEVVGKYFAIDQVPLNVYVLTVPASAYVGIGLGGAWAEGGHLENMADARTGMVFGDGPIRLGIGYTYRAFDIFQGLGGGEHEIRGEILIGLK
jgi:hypothetical protein